jgi:hypothetical protein
MFKRLTDDVLTSMAESEARSDLADLGVRELDPDDPDAEPYARPVSLVLFYRPSFDLYLAHVACCEVCSGGSIADQCLTGDARSMRASQAVSRMERTAKLN